MKAKVLFTYSPNPDESIEFIQNEGAAGELSYQREKFFGKSLKNS
jgi:hypothetical protein